MGSDNTSDKMVAVLVIDMQENMWEAYPEDGEEVPAYMKGVIARRKQAMGALAEDVREFTDSMRDNGAKIIWVLMENDEVSDYGGLVDGLEARETDIIIDKTMQSPYPENQAFFEELKREAELDGKELQIKICGVWALECIINAEVTLHEGEYHSRVVGDLILDSGKPCMDDDRPDFAEAHALHTMGEVTGLGPHVSQWSADLVQEQGRMHLLSVRADDDDPTPV